jgi:hypothetical protein
MSTVLIGGSRRISRLNKDIQERLDRIIEKRLPIIIGDANGADKAVQRYLSARHYELVQIFCSGESYRNNLGDWPVRSIDAGLRAKDFRFYAAKDRAMAEEASYGFLIWDGESAGTLAQLLRLVRRGKKALVYLTDKGQFVELAKDSDWRSLMARCSAFTAERAERQVASEPLPRPLQGNLL